MTQGAEPGPPGVRRSAWDRKNAVLPGLLSLLPEHGCGARLLDDRPPSLAQPFAPLQSVRTFKAAGHPVVGGRAGPTTGGLRMGRVPWTGQPVSRA